MFKKDNLYWKNRNKNHPNLIKTQFKKRQTPWIKGKKKGIYKKCQICGKDIYIFPCFLESRGKFCSLKCRGLSQRGKPHNNNWLGKHHSKESKLKISTSNKGKKPSLEHRKNMSIARKKLFILSPNRQSREKSPAWKGGIISDRGYVYIKDRNHPFCNKQGYIAEHRLVMEKVLGRYLFKEEVPHHINKIHNDNRPKNLILFKNNSVHKTFENIEYYKNKKIDPNDIIFDGRKYGNPQ